MQTFFTSFVKEPHSCIHSRASSAHISADIESGLQSLSLPTDPTAPGPNPTYLQVYIIEANPRASRTVPFVAKAIGHPVAKYASLVMSGRTLAEIGFTEEPTLNHVAVKEAVLPFDKFPGAYPSSLNRTVNTGATNCLIFMGSEPTVLQEFNASPGLSPCLMSWRLQAIPPD